MNLADVFFYFPACHHFEIYDSMPTQPKNKQKLIKINWMIISISTNIPTTSLLSLLLLLVLPAFVIRAYFSLSFQPILDKFIAVVATIYHFATDFFSLAHDNRFGFFASRILSLLVSVTPMLSKNQIFNFNIFFFCF